MKKKKVLIADDSKTFLLLEELLLSNLSFEVLKAYNGIEAFQITNKEKPDLILLDINMPEMDGIECCRLLKSSVHTKHIPVIIVTSHQEIKQDCFKAGCDDIIIKPINNRNLISLIKKYL